MIRRGAAVLRHGGAAVLSLLIGAAMGGCAPTIEARGAAAPSDPQLVSQFVSSYQLGSGDVIAVRVFGEPDLSVSGMRLSDSGTVFLPTIGELAIAGVTLGDVEQLVADRLRGRILMDPRVAVTVEQYRPFFISGMVRMPGAYPYQPGLTVRKAWTLAGGLDERASLRNIQVIRARDPAQRAQRVTQDALIFPGDVVTVEQSFF